MYEVIDFGALCFYWIWSIPFTLSNFKNVLKSILIIIKLVINQRRPPMYYFWEIEIIILQLILIWQNMDFLINVHI